MSIILIGVGFTKALRQTSLRYPNGRLVHYTYGTTDSAADALNRLDAIQDDDSGTPGDVLAAYTYLGLGTVVIEDYQEPQIRLDLFGGSSGTYAGFDRFDRVVDHRWLNYNTSTDVDRFKYGYDRASNRIWKENTVSKAQTTPVYLDELYTYDGLHRLKTFDRGELNSSHTAITGTPAKEEDWTLDALGNWSGYIQNTDGTTDLNQQRSANAVNEITDITESAGSSWVTPAYDKNGNMTLMPQPENPTASFTCSYDPWNHLVQVADSTSTIAVYSYDGTHRRVTKTADSETRHYLYTPQWQTIEERVDSSTYADRHFIWGPLYIDHLILRDRDTTEPKNGALDERIFVLQDGIWNVTALSSVEGLTGERCQYSPFGLLLFTDSDYFHHLSSDYDWNRSFSGHIWDVSGLYLCRQRIQHVNLGWLQRDMLNYHDAFHLYLYAKNSPLVFLDPSGLAAFTVDADAFIPWAWVSIPPIGNGVIWSEVKGNNRDFSSLPTRDASNSKQFNWIVAESCGCRRSNLQDNARVDFGRGLDSSTRRDKLLFWWIYHTDKGSANSTESATGKCATHFVHPASCHTNIYLSMTGHSPLRITYMPAAINYSYHVQLFHSGNHVWWLVAGHHDGFPAHEFWLRHNGQVLSHHSFKPPGTNWIGSAARLLGLYDRQNFFDSGDLEVDDVCCCS